MTGKRGLAATALLVLAFAACSKTSTTTPPPVTNALIKMSPVGVRVHLVKAGSAPRQQLRLQLVKGSAFNSSVTFHVAVGVSVGGNSINSISLPAFTMGLKTVVSDVTPNGSTVDFTFDRVDVAPGGNPSVTSAMQAAAKKVVGLHARTTLDDKGTALAFGVENAAGADAQTQQLISQLRQQASSLSIPFPAEAVGKGARWQATTALELQGVRETATVTYVLQDVTGTTVNLQILTNAVVPDQAAAIPGLPAGVSAHVNRSVIKGGGVVATDLTQPLPSTFDQAGEGTISVDVKQGTQSQRLLEKITVDTKITSTKAT